MADPKKQTQTKDQRPVSVEAAEEEKSDLISIDEIDKMILSEDPQFAEDLAKVRALPVDGSIDLDIVELESELPPPKNQNFSDKIYFFRLRLSKSIRQLGPLVFKVGKESITIGFAFLGRKRAEFKSFGWKLKILAIVLLVACLFTVVFVIRSYTHGVLPGDKALLMASMEEWATQSYKYDSETEMDSFYDSPRAIQNIMALPKMVVNLKESGGSGPNPMAAMEFFLEGMSPDAIVEVKDRETEIRDLFQRTIEEMSFDELDLPEGKQLLTERLRQALNLVLTKGKVRRVFIKEAVIKP